MIALFLTAPAESKLYGRKKSAYGITLRARATTDPIAKLRLAMSSLEDFSNVTVLHPKRFKLEQINGSTCEILFDLKPQDVAIALTNDYGKIHILFKNIQTLADGKIFYELQVTALNDEVR